MRSARLLTLVGTIALGACQTGMTSSGPDGQACELGFLGSLPLSPSEGHLALDATINGLPARLWLDTGAFSSVLIRAAAERLKLRPTDIQMGALEGIGGRQTLAVYRANSMQIGHLQGRGFPLGVSTMEHVLAPGIDGVVGMDFFSRTDLDIDLPGGRLNLYQPRHDCSHPSAYLQGPLYSLPLVGAVPGRAYAADSDSSQPRVKVSIHGVSLTATLDSGAPQNILFRNGADRLGLRDLALPGDPHVMSGGIGPKMVNAALHTMPPIEIGDLELRNLSVAMLDQRMEDADILLGLDFFLRVHVWISHSSGTLILQFPASPSPLGTTPPSATSDTNP